MCEVTRKSIKDSDIDLARVEKRLLEIAEEIKINNKKTDGYQCYLRRNFWTNIK